MADKEKEGGMEIHCNGCGQYVGTIRNAKLMKGLTFTCPKCVTIDSDNHHEWLNTTTATKGDYKLPGQGAFNDIIQQIFNPKEK